MTVLINVFEHVIHIRDVLWKNNKLDIDMGEVVETVAPPAL